jgi:ankyrin repeat protein
MVFRNQFTMNPLVRSELRSGVESDDVVFVEGLIAEHKQDFERIFREGCDGEPLFALVRSVAMADLFLEAGVSVQMISGWWGPGFGLGKVATVVAEHLANRGVQLTVHAAAGLGMIDRLRAMIDQRPELVFAKGGDGCRPLHFARNVDIARLLVDWGAPLDVRDDDHDSTPAQWRIQEAPEVTRYLLAAGAQSDIFMAAGLGDLELAKQLVANNPDCTSYRIGNNRGPFPGIGAGNRGGTIYQWTLGFNRSPHEVARERGYSHVYEFLWEHTPAVPQLLVACMTGNRTVAMDLVTRNPGLVLNLDEDDRMLLAKCCWETNQNREAVRLMLDLGFPIEVPERNHGYSALHNAAWCGDAVLVELLLRRGHPVALRDPIYHATALGFALHSHRVAQRHPDGDFPQVVKLLLEAGVPLDEGQHPSGDAVIDRVIESCLAVRR